MARRAPTAWRAAGALVVATVIAAAACAPTPTPTTGPPSVLMIANHSQGFFSLPWPNAIRKTPGGQLDVSGMPGVALNPLSGQPLPPIPLLPQVVTNAGNAVTDFGVNTAIYFETTTTIDPTTLPTPAQTITPGSSVALVDLDDADALAPTVVNFRATGDEFQPDNTLAVLPYPGHPLHSGHRYLAVVYSSVHSSTGTALAPAPLIAALGKPWTSSTGVSQGAWMALQGQLADADAAATASGHDPDSIVAFTEYRTQDVGVQMASIAHTIATMPAPSLTITTQRACASDSGAEGTQTSYISGTISMPSFQTGQYPYLLSGGAIATDSSGNVVVTGMRPVAFSARVPCGTPPAAGWPLAAYIDGTGGDADIDSSVPPFDRAGILTGVIAPEMTGASDPTLTTFGIPADEQTELLFYNFINPAAGRGNSVQQAADHLSLLRALTAVDLDGTAFGSPVPVTTNPAIELISGQSQGAATLSLVASEDPQVTGVISGAGGAGIYHSVAHGMSRRALFAELTGDINSMDELNPLMQLLQTVIEEADGSNYADAHANYLNISGIADSCVTIESARHLDEAIGLTVLNQQAPAALYGDAALEPPTAALPYTVASGPVRVDVEHRETHWGAFDSATTTLRNSFAQAIAHGQTPVIPASAYLTSPRANDECGTRWDAPTNMFGR